MANFALPGAAQADAPTKMYWAEFGGNVIERANLDGTIVETVITGLGGPVAFVLIGPSGVTPPDADLKVVKTDAPNPVIAGTNLTHTLTVTNLSTTTAATNVKVKDKIPPETTNARESGFTD